MSPTAPSPRSCKSGLAAHRCVVAYQLWQSSKSWKISVSIPQPTLLSSPSSLPRIDTLLISTSASAYRCSYAPSNTRPLRPRASGRCQAFDPHPTTLPRCPPLLIVLSPRVSVYHKGHCFQTLHFQSLCDPGDYCSVPDILPVQACKIRLVGG